MSKTDYLKMLRTVHPGEDETVYELARQFHSMTKAKHYIALLETCNTNADIAWKAMRAMYVSGDIDEIKAMSRKFIRLLLPFVCLEKQGEPNSIAYHVKAMLNDDTVRKERQEFQERQKAAVQVVSHELQPVQVELPKISEGIILQIPPNPDNQDFFRQLLELIRQGQIQVIQVQNSGSETVAHPIPNLPPAPSHFASMHRAKPGYLPWHVPIFRLAYRQGRRACWQWQSNAFRRKKEVPETSSVGKTVTTSKAKWPPALQSSHC